jgi:hypothetical protein
MVMLKWNQNCFKQVPNIIGFSNQGWVLDMLKWKFVMISVCQFEANEVQHKR